MTQHPAIECCRGMSQSVSGHYAGALLLWDSNAMIVNCNGPSHCHGSAFCYYVCTIIFPNAYECLLVYCTASWNCMELERDLLKLLDQFRTIGIENAAWSNYY